MFLFTEILPWTSSFNVPWPLSSRFWTPPPTEAVPIPILPCSSKKIDWLSVELNWNFVVGFSLNKPIFSLLTSALKTVPETPTFNFCWTVNVSATSILLFASIRPVNVLIPPTFKFCFMDASWSTVIFFLKVTSSSNVTGILNDISVPKERLPLILTSFRKITFSLNWDDSPNTFSYDMLDYLIENFVRNLRKTA